MYTVLFINCNKYCDKNEKIYVTVFFRSSIQNNIITHPRVYSRAVVRRIKYSTLFRTLFHIFETVLENYVLRYGSTRELFSCTPSGEPFHVIASNTRVHTHMHTMQIHTHTCTLLYTRSRGTFRISHGVGLTSPISRTFNLNEARRGPGRVHGIYV